MLNNILSSNYLSFTCLTCKARFDKNDAQRAHYKSDWHKYNLKRKIASLPILSENEFNDMLNKEKLKTIYNCDICSKVFHNENTLKDHKASKKHSEKLSIFEKNKSDKSCGDESCNDFSSNEFNESKINWKKKFAEAETDEEFDKILHEKIKCSKKIEENECLFCNFICQSFEGKMEHMKNVHSFYIPDIEYLSDLKGLINYLSEKVSIRNACIYCNKIFHSLEAIIKHMLNKGHMKINYEEGPDFEVAKFYNFCCLNNEYDENNEIDCSDDNYDNGNRHTLTVTSEGTELILPNGAHIGHRGYKRYYNQNLRDNPRNNCSAIMTTSEKYKALGYYNIGSSGMTIEKERIEKMKETRERIIKYSQDRERLGVKFNCSFIAYGRRGNFERVFLQ